MSRPPVYTTGDNKLVNLAYELGQTYLNTDLETLALALLMFDLLVGKDENFPFIMYGPGLITKHIK